MGKARLDTGRLAQAFILFNFSIYLFKLFKTGEINRLVAPYLSSVLSLSFLLIVVLTCYAFLTSFTQEEQMDCECCEHERRPAPKIAWLLLVLPPVIGVCFPVPSLNVSMLHSALHTQPIERKHVVENDKNTEKESEKNNDNKKAVSKELSLLDLQDNFVVHPDSYINKPFTLTGMVYHPPGWPTNQMIVMRYMITCCTADASAIGVIVEANEAAKYKDNSWVRVKGTMLAKNISGADIIVPTSWVPAGEKQPVLLANSIQNISEPKEPYLFVPLINLTPGAK